MASSRVGEKHLLSIAARLAFGQNGRQERPALLYGILAPEQHLVSEHAIEQDFLVGIENRAGIFLVIEEIHGHVSQTVPRTRRLGLEGQ